MSRTKSGNRRPKLSTVKKNLTGEKAVELLRQGQTIRLDLEQHYARLQQVTAEDLQFTSR